MDASLQKLVSRIAICLSQISVTVVLILFFHYIRQRIESRSVVHHMVDFFLIFFVGLPLIGAKKINVTGVIEDKAFIFWSRCWQHL